MSYNKIWAIANQPLQNMTVFWVVTPCISHTGQRFGGTYRLHLQGRFES
jgi:hypothetical protein